MSRNRKQSSNNLSTANKRRKLIELNNPTGVLHDSSNPLNINDTRREICKYLPAVTIGRIGLLSRHAAGINKYAIIHAREEVENLLLMDFADREKWNDRVTLLKKNLKLKLNYSPQNTLWENLLATLLKYSPFSKNHHYTYNVEMIVRAVVHLHPYLALKLLNSVSLTSGKPLYVTANPYDKDDVRDAQREFKPINDWEYLLSVLWFYDVKILEQTKIKEILTSLLENEDDLHFKTELTAIVMTTLHAVNHDWKNLVAVATQGRRVNLRAVRIDKAMLDGVNLSYAVMDYANLTDTSMKKAFFNNAIMDRSYLDGVDFESSQFRFAVMIVEAQNCNFSGTDCTGADFQSASLDEINFSNACLKKATLSLAKVTNCKIDNADLSGTCCRGTDFSFSNLSQAKLRFALMDGADFFAVDLSNAILSHASLIDADLRHATITGAQLNGAVLIGARLTDQQREYAIQQGAYLTSLKDVIESAHDNVFQGLSMCAYLFYVYKRYYAIAIRNEITCLHSKLKNSIVNLCEKLNRLANAIHLKEEPSLELAIVTIEAWIEKHNSDGRRSMRFFNNSYENIFSMLNEFLAACKFVAGPEVDQTPTITSTVAHL